jgi:hypothetical protein
MVAGSTATCAGGGMSNGAGSSTAATFPTGGGKSKDGVRKSIGEGGAAKEIEPPGAVKSIFPPPMLPENESRASNRSLR